MRRFKRRALRTTMLMAPVALAMGVGSAHAQCVVTGGGTVAIPNNGATVTCPANTTTNTNIGNGSTSADVTLENGHILDTTGGTVPSIYLTTSTVTLGDGARIDAGGQGVFVNTGDATVTLGANAQINALAAGAATILAFGGNQNITLGAGAQLNAANGGVFVLTAGTTAITLQEDAQINTGNFGISNFGSGGKVITLNQNSQIVAGGGGAIFGSNTAADTVDTSGLISAGGGNSVNLQGGNDNLIVRTGASFVGQVTGGAGADTLTFFGTGSENDNFVLFETTNMNGESWTLTGINSLGTTNINSGVFFQNGGTSSDVNVNAGGTFAGIGTTIGNIVNDGTTAPGNSIGTKNITGNFTQNAGGVLEIEFDPASSDLLNITGAATLDGTVVFREFAPGIADGTTHTFLQTTGGIAGAFSTVTDSSLFINAVVTPVGNNLQATFNRILTENAAQTSSESAVANAIDSVLFSDPTSILQIDSIVNGLSGDAAASSLFASQSGQALGAAITSGFDMMTQSANIALSRLSAPEFSFGGSRQIKEALGLSGVSAGDELKSQQGSVWAEFMAGFGDIEGDRKARGIEYNTSGFAGGVERYLGDDLVIGTFGSFSKAEAEVDGLADDADTKTYQLGLYAGLKDGPWRYQGTISGAWMNFDTERPTPSGLATSDFDGAGLFLQGRASYDIDFEKWFLSPIIGFEGALLYHEAYEESGAGVLNLSVDSETTRQFRSLLGFSARSAFKIDKERFAGGLILKPNLTMLWAHEFLDQNAKTNANFTSASAIRFQSEGPEKNRDFAKLRAELLTHRPDHDRTSFYLAYEGNLASDFHDHSAIFGLKFKW